MSKIIVFLMFATCVVPVARAMQTMSVCQSYLPNSKGLSVEEFEKIAGQMQVVILDTRSTKSFANGHIPNAINIGIDGNFEPWVQTIIPDTKQKILVVSEPDTQQEVITLLKDLGYEHIVGFLLGGFQAWQQSGKQIDKVKTISVEELSLLKDARILDVRSDDQYGSGHVVGARNIPLDVIENIENQIDKDKTYYVHCASGYRSMIFVSILKARGFNNLIDITGGFKAIRASEKFQIRD